MATDRTKIRRVPHKQVFEPSEVRRILDRAILAHFESSMHYQSLMALGSARSLEGEEKQAALRALTAHLFPERITDLRDSTEQELKATSVLAFPLNEISIKISNGQPEDSASDLESEIWAGILPITSQYGIPISADNLRSGIRVPDYISRWPENRL